MSLITIDQLKQIINNKFIDQWVSSINKILPCYDIDTPLRLAAFISECAYESNGFNELTENLNYSAEGLLKTFPTHFTSDEAQQYQHQPEKIANKVYANRMGNGDESTGDGWKYSGKGLIQLTGKENQQFFGDSIHMDVTDVPGYLQTFEGAIQSACFFWENNNLNALADKGLIDQISTKINGGTLGLEDRRTKYQFVLKVLGS